MSDTNYPRSLVDQNFGLCISPDDLIFPFYYQSGGNYYRPWKWFYQSGIKDTGSVIDENEDIFKISLDVQHFKPNEINVKVSDGEVIIEGNHKEKQDSHGFISRQFTRRYILPYNCLSESVECTLSSDGVLIITAKKALKGKQNKEVSVPIQYHSASSKSDQVEVKQNAAVEESTSSQCVDIRQQEIENKKDMQVMLKGEHCRLLKPEFLGPAVLEATQKTNKDVTLKLSEDKLESTSMSTNISKETICEEKAEEISRNRLLQEGMKIAHREAQEINMKAENVTMEQQISEMSSEIIAGIKSSKDTLRSEAKETISQNQPLITENAKLEEQISQKASTFIEEIMSESSSNIAKGEKSSQNAFRALEENEKTSESETLQQSQNIVSQETYNSSENVKIEEQFSEKSLATIEEVTSASSLINALGERIIKDSMSSGLEMSTVNKEKLEKMMTSEATKIEECKEEFQAASTMCSSMQANMQASMSSKTAAFEEFSSESTEVTVIDKGSKMEGVMKNSIGSSGLSGVNATIENIIEKCNAEMADIANKIAESHTGSTEKSNLSMSFKSSESQESSFTEETFSSVSSNIKGSTEHKSLVMQNVIAELKDASENM